MASCCLALCFAVSFFLKVLKCVLVFGDGGYVVVMVVVFVVLLVACSSPFLALSGNMNCPEFPLLFASFQCLSFSFIPHFYREIPGIHKSRLIFSYEHLTILLLISNVYLAINALEWQKAHEESGEMERTSHKSTVRQREQFPFISFHVYFFFFPLVS